MPLPPVCSIVNVYSTTLPCLSVIVMFVVEPTRSTRTAPRLVAPGGVPARRRPAGFARPLADQRGALRGVVAVQQARGRHRVERRVADVLVAVGVGVARRLEVEVQRAVARDRAEEADVGPGLDRGEDVQRLADRGAAAGRRAHAEHVDALVLHLRGLALLGAVALEVVEGHDAGAHLARGALAQRRLRDGAHDRLRHRARVEALRRALLGQQPVGLGQRGVADRRADVARGAVLVEVQRRGRRRSRRRSPWRRRSGRRTSGRRRSPWWRRRCRASARGPASTCRSRAAPSPTPRGVPGTPTLDAATRWVARTAGEAAANESASSPAAPPRASRSCGPVVVGAVDEHEPAAAHAARVGLDDAEHAGRPRPPRRRRCRRP